MAGVIVWADRRAGLWVPVGAGGACGPVKSGRPRRPVFVLGQLCTRLGVLIPLVHDHWRRRGLGRARRSQFVAGCSHERTGTSSQWSRCDAGVHYFCAAALSDAHPPSLRPITSRRIALH